MKRIRAIYTNDITCKEMPIFELKEDGYFRMIGDEEFKYDKKDVFRDEDFMVFGKINNEDWNRVDIRNAVGGTEGIIAFKEPNPWNIHIEGNKIIIPENIIGISVSFIQGFTKAIFEKIDKSQLDEYYEIVGDKRLVEKFDKAIYY